jgi:hypothetical protein
MVKKLMRPVDGSISINRPNVPDNKRIDYGKSLALDSTGTAKHSPCLDDRAKGTCEFRVTVMEQVSTVLKEAPFIHGYVSGDLLHPPFIWMRRQTRYFDLATLQGYEEQHHST